MDPDPYVFGHPGSASGSVNHKYGSGSVFLLCCNFFLTFHQDLFVAGPRGSASGSARQRYGSENPDPYQNVKDPGLWIRIHFLRIRIQSLMLETNTDPDPNPDPVPDPDPIRIQGFNNQKWKKITAKNFFLFFFDQKLQFTYP